MSGKSDDSLTEKSGGAASGGASGAAYTVVVLALCAAIMLGVQLALVWLPNIELVSLFVIVFTLIFKYKALYIIYTFVFLQGLVHGFNPWWWLSYLYVWTILAGVTLLFRSCKSPVIWGVIAGMFGLTFGALTAIPHLVISGPVAALAYWVSGIPFDLIHCISNFAIVLALWLPMMKFMEKLPIIR